MRGAPAKFDRAVRKEPDRRPRTEGYAKVTPFGSCSYAKVTPLVAAAASNFGAGEFPEFIFLAPMTHDGDNVRHRYRPSERTENSDGPYESKPTDVWFYVCIIGFFVFLRALPWIMRKFGCCVPPPRPPRTILRRDPDEEENEAMSEEERRKLVEKNLSSAKVMDHSSVHPSCNCVTVQAGSTGKEDPSRSQASTVTADEDEDVGDGEASTNDDPNTLDPCHICLDHFCIGEDVSWSNVSKCEHCFHSKCITEWLLKNEACPCCRKNMIDLTNVRDIGTMGDAEVRQEEEDVEEQVADMEIVQGGEETREPLPKNEESLATAEEGLATKVKGNGEEMMCFCVEHGLRVRLP